MKFVNQYAYTKQLSTTDALVTFSTEIATNLDNKDTTAVQALLLDFSKAFDRMKPDTAVSKLIQLNVRPALIQVVKCFLTNRQQQVKYRNHKSSTKKSRIGVPQGTIMGPLLWNVFVNDLKPNVSHIKYADNTMLYNIVKAQDIFITNSTPQSANIEFARNPLQEGANFASNWCNENAMLLNTAKSSVITFTLMKEIHSEQIVLNNNQIS